MDMSRQEQRAIQPIALLEQMSVRELRYEVRYLSTPRTEEDEKVIEYIRSRILAYERAKHLTRLGNIDLTARTPLSKLLLTSAVITILEEHNISTAEELVVYSKFELSGLDWVDMPLYRMLLRGIDRFIGDNEAV